MINITNNVVLLGRLTKDPTILTAKNEKKYCKFTIAINNRGKKDNQTTFVPLVAFGKQASFIEKYMHAGERVYVGASIENNDYEITKNDEKFNVYSFSFVVQQIEFADGRTKPDAEGKADDEFMLPSEEDPLDVERDVKKAEKPKEEFENVVEDELHMFDKPKGKKAEKPTEKPTEKPVVKAAEKEKNEESALDSDGFLADPFSCGDFL